MYVYIKSEPGLWTVGFYDPKGEWQPESDHSSKEKAAARVAYLNGEATPYSSIREISGDERMLSGPKDNGIGSTF